MRFDTKLFRLFFTYSFSLVLLISIVLLSLFYKQYSDARKENLYFLNVLLQTQTGYIIDGFERSAQKINNGRDLESFLSDDKVSRFFAEKFLIEQFDSVLEAHPYIEQIRIEKGEDILLSSHKPLDIDSLALVFKIDNSLYRIIQMETLIEDVFLVYIVSVNKFISDFNSFHRIPYDQIAYIIDNTWAVLFDNDGQSTISPVENSTERNLEINEKIFTFSRIDTPHLVRIAISKDSFFANFKETVVILVFFVMFSAVVLFLIIKYTSRSLTLPIRQLSKHALSLQKGDFTYFQYDGFMVDEVQNLVSSFNYMTDENRDFTNKLELEVINRTSVIEKQKNEMERISITDKLTGLNNRRSFDERIKQNFELAARTHLYMGLGIIDIDHFKEVNDSYGHLCGDEILKVISALLNKVFRRNGDSLFRYGGDEFIIMTLNQEDQRAEFLSLAEKLRVEVQNYKFVCDINNKILKLSISTGLFFAKVNDIDKYQSVLTFADNMLYKAKDQGRNKVLIMD